MHAVPIDTVCSFLLVLVDGLFFSQTECPACYGAVHKVTLILRENDVDSIRLFFFKLLCSPRSKLQMDH